MGFAGQELLKAAEFLNMQNSTGVFIVFLLSGALLAFFSLAFSYAFIDTPMTSKLIIKKIDALN